eukprot:TRINITY_DN6256_c0_g1_i1.p1 TRINITY_DN6256_c0_g1~~TRINITY_DN6256_c0_g1_i1.p1  ORF type:complete len:246 (-),score=84.71 TRINITY_DN6256_c0_g1_i1:29-766(-)
MTETIVTKHGSYHIQSTWADEDLFLTILAGTEAWAGTLEHQVFKDIDTRTGGALGDSWQMAKEAFGGTETSKYDIAIDNKKLIWRKVGGKAKIKITEIELKPVSFLDTQNELFGQLIESNNELKTKNKDFKRRQDNLVRDLKKSKNMLVEMEKEKSGIEDKLYERFLPILNAKKEKICDLEKNGGMRASVHALSDDEGDDYGSATDEDPDESTVSKESLDEAGPSNKRSKITMDDSLGLLDESLT